MEPGFAHLGRRADAPAATTATIDDPASRELTDVLPGDLELIAAAATAGTITTSASTVSWDGSIPAGDLVEMLIDARISTAAANQTISNQAEIFYDADGEGTNDTMELTDDPDVAGPDDPTAFVVGSVLEIPTLDAVGLVVMASLLVFAAGVLRRRQVARSAPARSRAGGRGAKR